MATFWAVWGWLPFGLFGSDKVRVDSKINEDEQYIWGVLPVSPSPCRTTPRWCTGGQERHEDHFLLERGPVRVLGGTTLQGSGEGAL